MHAWCRTEASLSDSTCEALIDSTLARAREVRRRAKELRQFAQSAVARWEWTVGARLGAPQPLASERYEGLSRVRRLAKPPREGEPGERYGFDAEGAVVWRHVPLPGGAIDVYQRRTPAGVEAVTFGAGAVRRAEFTRFSDGRAICSATVFDAGGHEWELYEYENGRLVRVRTHDDPQDPPYFTDPVDSEDVIDYDERGRVTRIVQTASTGVRQVLYSTRGAGPSKRTVAGDAVEELVSAVRAHVAAHPPTEPVYALLLQYDDERPLPPVVAFGAESYRTRVTTEGDDDGLLYLLWNPAEFDDFDPVGLGGQPLVGATDRLAELSTDLEAVDPDGTTARTVLRRACRRLNELDWRSTLKATDDFVVTCVGLEMDDFEADFKASVPSAELRRRVRRAGLLKR